MVNLEEFIISDEAFERISDEEVLKKNINEEDDDEDDSDVGDAGWD